MRAVVQRVNFGRVTIDDRVTADIGKGLVILLGVGPGYNEEKSAALAKKIAQLRIH
jgi:D-tyrosyl-tRNA(Tyr) deacylase